MDTSGQITTHLGIVSSSKPAANRRSAPTAVLARPLDLARKALLLLSSRWQTRRCTAVGRRVKVEGRLVVNNFGAIRLGDGVRIRATHLPVELGALTGGELAIGEGTFINSGVSICAQERVEIGRNVAIGNYTLIMDTDFHAVGDHTQAAEARPVVIEDDVWLAARVTVLKGVRIGHGAVVAAGAVVTKNVPPRTVVGGVPARVLRHLDAPAAGEGSPTG